MVILEKDIISEDNPLMVLITLLSVIGLYDISQEIMDEHYSIFNQNTMKKIILFSVIYLKTKSIYTSSLVSIFIVLVFPKVFFGKFSTCNSRQRKD